jgi:hypothetical protein
MNYQETINKIKMLFEANPMVPTTTTSPDVSALPEYILQDGTKIVVDKLEIGGQVTLDGSPAPDGEHQLQDGTIITTKYGMIAEISTPAEEISDESVTSNMGMVPAPAPTPDVKIAEQMASINTKMDEFVAKQKMLEDAMAKHGEAMKQMMALIEQMAKTPISEPASPVSNQYTSQKPLNKDERFESILEAINKIKNN